MWGVVASCRGAYLPQWGIRTWKIHPVSTFTLSLALGHPGGNWEPSPMKGGWESQATFALARMWGGLTGVTSGPKSSELLGAGTALLPAVPTQVPDGCCLLLVFALSLIHI